MLFTSDSTRRRPCSSGQGLPNHPRSKPSGSAKSARKPLPLRRWSAPSRSTFVNDTKRGYLRSPEVSGTRTYRAVGAVAASVVRRIRPSRSRILIQ